MFYKKIMDTLEKTTERINKSMATRGLCTRRQADDLIRAGVVFVNDQPAVLGAQVTPDDRIEIRDVDRLYMGELEYVAYYKPRGIVTHSATRNQKDVGQISGFPDLYPVGRLDKESEGLLILTNDGRITERLLHPRFAHEKEYWVEFAGHFPKNGEKKLLEGMVIEGETLTVKEVVILNRKQLTLVLTEGKKHQVRKMLAAIGLEVGILKRTRIMGVLLGALKPGAARVLKGVALKSFLKDLNL